MRGFHTNWTAPFFASNPKRAYYIETYELLTTILSALKWRQYNGGIEMITDETGARYYSSLGLEHLWDLGIHTGLEKINGRIIDPVVFWAAGKIFALQKQDAPVCMLDTDFIVWNNIDEQLKDTTLAAIHREPISAIYPGKSYFTDYLRAGYRLNEEWDWTEMPCNTAFLYIGDEGLKNYYTDESIQFMKNTQNASSTLTFMIFTEQRLLAMCAKSRGIPVKALLETDALEKQSCFSHVWGFKSVLKQNSEKNSDFCMGCIKRIIKDFPEEEKTLLNIKQIAPYYQRILKEGGDT